MEGIRPSQKAIDWLRQNPQFSPQFDEKFGQGTSAQYLEGPSDAPSAAAPVPPVEGEAAPEGDVAPKGEHQGTLGELFDGAAAGTAGFFESAGDLVTDIADSVGLPAAVALGSDADNGVVQFLSKDELDARGGDPVFGRGDKKDAADIAGIDARDTVAGKLAEGITQFAWGFAGAGAVVKGGGFLASTAKGAIGDFVAFDEHEARLSNLVQQHPTLANPVTEYLSANEEDKWAEGRFKNVVEGMFLGAAADLLFKSVKGLKAAKRLFDSGDKEGAQRVLQEAQDTTEAALKGTDGAETAARQSADADALGESLAPQGGPENVADALKADRVTQRLDDDAVNEIAQRLDRGDGSVEDVSEAFNVRKWNTTQEGKEAVNEIVHRLRETDPEVFDTVQTTRRVKQIVASMGGTPEDEAIFWRNMADLAGKSEEIPAMVFRARAETALIADQLPGVLSEYHALTQVGDAAGAAALKEKVLRGLNIAAERWAQTKAVQQGVARGTAIGRAVQELKAIFKNPQTNPDDVFGAFLEWTNGNMSGDFDAFAKRMGDLNKKPHWVLRSINYVLSNKTWDISNEFFINSILSGPKTHVVNLTSNTIEAIVLPAERAFGSLLRGDLRAVRADMAQYAGLVHGLKDSFQMAKTSLLEERNLLDPAHAVNELTPHHVITAKNLLPNADTNMLSKPINLIGKGLRLPSRFLASEDEFFKQINYRSRLYSDGYRKALENGLKGKQASAFASDYVQKGFDATGAAVDKAALEYARRATFTNDLEYGIGHAVQKAVNFAPPLRTVLPFVRTPTNLIRNTLNRLPVTNLIDKMNREAILGFHGAEKQAEAFARLFTGSTIMGLAAYLAEEGIITGSAPRDPELREQWSTGSKPGEGKQAYSFHIGDHYYSFDRGDPRFTVFALVADAVQIMQNSPEHERDDLATTMVLSFTNNLASKTYLKGLTDAMEALTSDEPEVFRRYWHNQVAGRVVPFSAMMSQLNPDRELKEIRGYTDALLAKVPGFSDLVPARRNVLGEKTLKPQDYFISPVAVSKDTSDPLRAELAVLNAKLAKPRKSLQGTRIDLTKYREAGTSGGATAYDKWQELTGTIRVGRYTLKERLERLVTSDAYTKQPALEDSFIRSRRADMINQVILQYRARAWKTMLRDDKWQNLRNDVRKEKQNTVRARSKGEDVIQSLSQ